MISNDNILISLNVAASRHDSTLGLEVWLDNQKVHDVVPTTNSMSLDLELDDNTESEHELKFVLKNKSIDHTKINADGNIIEDYVINIDNLSLDQIQLGSDLYKQFVYKHNFNDNGPETEDKFYGTMGCNGTVTLKFTTPLYLWLLENM
jgi:hypothetical protein